MSQWCASRQSSMGIFFMSCCSVSSTVFASGKPRRLLTRNTWVSTAMGGHAEGVGEDDVCSLAAHAGEGGQFLHGMWDLAAVFLGNDAAGLDDVPSLAFESAAFHQRIQLIPGTGRHSDSVRVSPKDLRCDLIDLFIRALRRQHSRHKRFIRVRKFNSGPRSDKVSSTHPKFLS